MELKDNQYILYEEKITSNSRTFFGGPSYAITSNKIKEQNSLGRIISTSLMHLLLQTDILTHDSIEILSNPKYEGNAIGEGFKGEILTYQEKGVNLRILRKIRKIPQFKKKDLELCVSDINIKEFLRD